MLQAHEELGNVRFFNAMQSFSNKDVIHFRDSKTEDKCISNSLSYIFLECIKEYLANKKSEATKIRAEDIINHPLFKRVVYSGNKTELVPYFTHYRSIFVICEAVKNNTIKIDKLVDILHSITRNVLVVKNKCIN